ncbi:helix-turn-helix domain-containing protein [Pseudoclavibacter helvolus]|uniref:DNA-binding Xre family transcriptional regulator n=1 Tax=Pseudoclavibacter helvolus TaxID=255205 RepID=A0A7W4UPJ0_9MICO|nr:helix-turn-helix transcriptional regulator [Pseudoclavibacter helvolus]MBB2958267.1 DNA-binding Xre family transcriptional regulator [Pseudoclavibacter helvolus]
MTTPTIQWNLRKLMAANGMFQTTDLIEPLRKHGVNLSREQVYRLVTKVPERLNMAVLVALCHIFGCGPNDLVEIPDVAAARERSVVNGSTSSPVVQRELKPVPARIQRPPKA